MLYHNLEVKRMENIEISSTLEEVADLLEIQGANPFRVRAYRTAVRTVEDHGEPFRKLVAEERSLTELPGIGKEMASHIKELVQTGKLGILEDLRGQVPRSLVELTRLPGVGPKKARRLWKELQIDTVDKLEKAILEGKVAALAGFGEKSEQKILHGIREYRRHLGRFKLSDADQYVIPLLEYMAEAPGIERLQTAGSYRRRKETIGDIDLLVVAKNPEPVMRRFTHYPKVEKVLLAGDTRGTVQLTFGLQVDLRIVPPKSYGAALVYFTGSKEHNIKLRQRALDRNLRVSEYGVFRVREEEEKGTEVVEQETAARRDPWEGQLVAGREEKEVYATVGLPWIPPELRDDRGEIEAAARGVLPDLVQIEDIRGDLQMHSTWSDGKNSIQEMLLGCARKGYEYLAMSDHSKALAMTGGLDAERLRSQWKEIEEVVAQHHEIKLLRSLEVDILADGRLDLEDEMLARLDIVIVSVHSRFDLPLAQQTKRILTAIQHPEVNILAHPTARLINRRGPIAIDLDEVLRCAAEYQVAVELNAHPDRLDLKDTHLMLAKKLGVRIVISTDAHRVQDLDLMRYGVEQARRAWLEKKDILNTLPVEKLLKAFEK